MKVPEHFRITDHPQLGSNSSFGCNGFFVIPHPKIALYYFQCQVSDGMGWQHVSVSLILDTSKGFKAKDFDPVHRCPTWEEMCFIKSLFWDDETAVMQLHPPKSEWVNNYPYCLHLWKPDQPAIPLPLKIMVGKQELNTKINLTTNERRDHKS